MRNTDTLIQEIISLSSDSGRVSWIQSLTQEEAQAITDIFRPLVNEARRIRDAHYKERRWYSLRYESNVHEYGYVYLMRAENGLYKIGLSCEPDKRLRNIQDQSPMGVELIHLIKYRETSTLEIRLHELFEDKRHHSEWFTLSDVDVAFIKLLYEGNILEVFGGSLR